MHAIAILGDRKPGFEPHEVLDPAFRHAADRLGARIRTTWLGTRLLRDPAVLDGFAGYLISPGSPYEDLDAMLEAIRIVREAGRPVLGNCAGFQHMALEFARSVAGLADAISLEYGAGEGTPLVSVSACALAGQTLPVRIAPGSLAHALYRVTDVEETYYCRYALEPAHVPALERAGLKITGRDPEGLGRVLELAGHPFYLGTLFVPQTRSRPDAPHPLVLGFVRAVLA